MKRVLVVENEEGEDVGLLGPPLRAGGCALETVRAWAGEPVPALGAHDAVVVLGGSPSVYDITTGPWMADVMRLIREAHVGARPVLGVCLGAQLLAHALGGRVVPGTGPEVGFEPVEWLPAARDDPVLGALPERAAVFSLHHDAFVPPPGATRLASSKRYAEQAFRLRDSWGLQFHVDLSPETLDRILRGDPDIAALGLDADDLVSEARRRAPEMRAAADAVARGFASRL